MDLISHIAKTFNFKSRLDADETRIIPGTLGELFEIDAHTLGVLYLPPTPRKGWKNRREELIALGGRVLQDGDIEGSIAYDMDDKLSSRDKKFIKAAARCINIKAKRKITEEAKVALLERLGKARQAKRGRHDNEI